MAPIQKKELAPGDSTVVELVFNTRTSKGRVSKNARVTSNDPSKSAFSIDFSANILYDPDTLSTIRFLPQRLAFDQKSGKIEVRLENHDTTEAKLAITGLPPDNVRAKIKNNVVKAGKTTKLEFEWKGDALPEYEVTHVITFETGIKNAPRFSIPYTIKGTKGARPGATPDHAATPPKPGTPNQAKPGQATTNPGKMTAKPPTDKPVSQQGDIYKQYTPDSVNVEKPLPGTQQWPPR